MSETTGTEATAKTNANESTPTSEPTVAETIPNYQYLAPSEQLYELCKLNADAKLIEELILNKNASVNELAKNGDTCLCVACNKGYESLVELLIKHKASVNQCRSVNSIMSTNLTSGLITGRRQSRYASVNQTTQNQQAAAQGESPLYLAIKYGFEQIAIRLIDSGAEIYNFSTTNKNPDFDKSLVQEVIRLNRVKILNKILEFTFDSGNKFAIDWIFAKRFDILRQLFISENMNALRVVLPYILESNNHINGELLTHVLNYLLMKTKIQDTKSSEKAYEILETIMEIASTLALDDESGGGASRQFTIDDLDLLIKSFLATVRALFNKISSDDNRTELLYFRFSLLFSILKYDNSRLNLINSNEFIFDIDYTFSFFYTKLKDTGENVLKLVEFYITFYDTMITMNLIHLDHSSLTSLLSQDHVKQFDVLGDFLIQRSLQPLDLKELARIRIKEALYPYNYDSIKQLPNVIDDKCKEYLFFI